MIELLFNYPQSVWREASLAFNSSWPVWAWVVALSAAALMILFSLRRLSISWPRRALVAVLQTFVVALLLVMLWQPVLRVTVSEKAENTVAWVLDNSASMTLNDADAAAAITRRAAALEAMRTLSRSESEPFTAQFFAVGESLDAVDSLDELSQLSQARVSRIAPAIQELLATPGESSLAGVVLFTDGADNSGAIDARWWQGIAAAGVPVHVVGIGQAFIPGDLELVDVSLPGAAPPQSRVTAQLRIRHASVPMARVRVMAGEALLSAEDVVLPADSEQSVHSISFATGERGVRSLEFHIEPISEPSESGPAAAPVSMLRDPNPLNNRQPRILRVIDSPGRILYVEGEPRWEYKFLRRALDAHPGVDIVSLLRTSPNKFYRQGVRDGSELADGFPQGREQLFAYQAVIIGSLEAVELSSDQQINLRDFVSTRGGTLLMLAGRQGLADGGWGRSVVAAALPVRLASLGGNLTFMRKRTQLVPTLAGLRTPWLHLGDDADANLEAWQGLPEVADSQRLGQVKPGAVVLLERKPGHSRGRGEPVLVTQRYGRGQSLVLGTSGTWRWQMSLPHEDQRHERFWRQLLSMAVEQSLPRLQISSASPVLRDQSTTELVLNGYSADFSHLQVSDMPVTLTDPAGRQRQLTLYPDTEHPGRFRGELALDAAGPWSVSARTPLVGESPAAEPIEVESFWVLERGNAESFGSGLQHEFLQRISEVTGGTYLPLSEADRLNEILATDNAALKRESRLPLWNMPALFLLILLLKLADWGLRLRWKRL